MLLAKGSGNYDRKERKQTIGPFNCYFNCKAPSIPLLMMHLSFISFILFLMMGTTLHVNGATNTLANANNSQTPRCNKTPVNHCNCQCTLNQDSSAIKSLEAKVEGLIGLNNNTCKNSDAVNSPEAKVASLNVLNNKTYGSSVAVESLETKMESLIGLKNNTSGISDAVKFLAAKVESISGLNNETSSIRDGVKSLEEKIESLNGLISRNSTFIPEAASKPKSNLIIIYVYENFYFSQYKVHLFIFLFRVLFLYVCFSCFFL